MAYAITLSVRGLDEMRLAIILQDTLILQAFVIEHSGSASMSHTIDLRTIRCYCISFI